MDFGANKTPVEVIKEDIQKKLVLETFILTLMKNGTENHGKNLISWKILIKSINVQVIMMLVLINMVLNVEHH